MWKKLKKGESIYELLKKYNVSEQVINNFISAVKPYYSLDQIKAGKKLEVIFDINRVTSTTSRGINIIIL